MRDDGAGEKQEAGWVGRADLQPSRRRVGAWGDWAAAGGGTHGRGSRLDERLETEGLLEGERQAKRCTRERECIPVPTDASMRDGERRDGGCEAGKYRGRFPRGGDRRCDAGRGAAHTVCSLGDGDGCLSIDLWHRGETRRQRGSWRRIRGPRLSRGSAGQGTSRRTTYYTRGCRVQGGQRQLPVGRHAQRMAATCAVLARTEMPLASSPSCRIP